MLPTTIYTEVSLIFLPTKMCLISFQCISRSVCYSSHDYLVHYDEKWCWGLVLRRNAKAYDSLELEATVMNTYHWNHINKVMGIAFVGFTFTNIIENGGEAIKLVFFSCK